MAERGKPSAEARDPRPETRAVWHAISARRAPHDPRPLTRLRSVPRDRLGSRARRDGRAPPADDPDEHGQSAGQRAPGRALPRQHAARGGDRDPPVRAGAGAWGARRAHPRQRREAARGHHGPHGRRRRRAHALVGGPVRGGDQGWLPVRPRRDRRQGDAGGEPRDDAAPQAARRRCRRLARARRRLRRQLRRGGGGRLRHGLADRQPSRAGARRVRAQRGGGARASSAGGRSTSRCRTPRRWRTR